MTETRTSVYCGVKNKAIHRYYCDANYQYAKCGKLAPTSIIEGTKVDLSELLFTKSRDYLIKCNNGQKVCFYVQSPLNLISYA